MPTLEKLEHVKDLERMKSAVKNARKSTAGGRFVFVFRSAAMEGGPALLISDPGRPVPKTLVKEVSQGGKAVKGRYRTEDKRLIFLPMQEVNKTRMEKAIVKLLHGALKPGQFEVRLPSEVGELENAEALDRQEIGEGLEGEETRNRSVAAVLGLGRKKVGEKIDAQRAQKAARQKLVGMLKEGIPSSLELTPTPLPKALQDIDETDTSPVGKARLAARDAALAAQEAEVTRARAADARQKLVLALEAGLLGGPLSDKGVTRAQEMLDDYDRSLARAEAILAQSRAQQELLRLQELRALQDEWSGGDQERLAAAEKAVQESQTRLKELDAESEAIQKARKEETERLEKLEGLRKDAWDAYNEADNALEEEKAALSEAQKHLTKLSKSASTDDPKLKAAKQEVERLVAVCQRRTEQLEALDKRSNDLDDQIKPRQAKTRALIQETATVNLKQAQEETQLARSEITAATKRQEGFQRQRAEIQEYLRMALNGRGGLDEQSIKEDEEAELELAESLQTAREARDLLLKKRTALGNEIMMLEAKGPDADLAPDARRERADEIARLRAEILALEPDLHKQHEAVSAREREHQAVRKRLREAEAEVLRVAGTDTAFHDSLEKLEKIDDGIRTAENDQIEARSRLELCQEQEEVLIREQKLEGGMVKALKLFEKNPQLSLFRHMTDPSKVQAAMIAMDKRTREDNVRRQQEGIAEEQTIQETVQSFINQIEDLKAAGASMAQLRQLWDHFPRELIPPSYRKELDGWVLMEEQLQAELAAQTARDNERGDMRYADKALDVGRTVGDGLVGGTGSLGGLAFSQGGTVQKLQSLNSNLSTVSGLADSLLKTGKITEAIPKDLMPQIALITTLSSVAAQGAKTIHQATLQKGSVLESGKKLSEGSPDPIKQLMLEEDLLKAVQSLIEDATKAGLSMAGTVVPFLSAAVSSADGFKLLAEMAARIYNAEQDRRLVSKAKKLDSSLTSSIQQSHTNEALKASEAAFSALGKFVQATGQATSSIGTFTSGGDMGATKTAGTVVSVVGMGVYYGTQAVVTVKSWSLAIACEVMVKKARSGDPRAQQEIFRHSGRYAKGLIALMARRNDPVALSYIKSRGLTPKMVEQSSPEIVRMYLLRRSGEDNFGEGPVDNAKAALSFLKTVGGGILSGLAYAPKKIIEHRAQVKQAELESVGRADLIYDLTPLHQSIDELLSCREMLSLIPEDAPQYAEASDMVHTWEVGLRATRQPLVKAIKGLEEKATATRQLITGLQKEISGSTDPEKIKAAEKNARRAEKILSTLQEQVGGYWQVLDRMAPVG